MKQLGLLTLTAVALSAITFAVPSYAQSTSEHVPKGLTEVQKRANERAMKESGVNPATAEAERQAAQNAAANNAAASGVSPNNPSTQGQRNADIQSGQGAVVEPSEQVGTTPPSP